MQHEQITLVVLGYVIGFITAFIGFGLVDDDYSKSSTTKETKVESYGIVANASHNANVAQNDEEIIESVAIKNDGMFVEIGSKERIVSAAALKMDDEHAGFHYAISEMIVSPDGRHLYYCAQTDPANSDCDNYIYKSTTDAIYPVTNVQLDQYVSSDIATLSVSWSEDGLLSVNELVSTSAEAPWMIQ